jgi:hypothetical protein
MRKHSSPNFIYKLLTFFNKIVNRFSSDKKIFFILFLLGIISLFFISQFMRIFFVTLLTGIGAVSLIHPRFFKFSHYLGFELCTMATVLVSLVYGPVFGMFTGFASLFGGFVLSGYFKPTYFISVLVMPIIGLLTPLFSHLPLLYIGIIMTILYDAIILPLYTLMGSRIHSSIIFFITHLLLNIWIFSTVAPFIYSLMI